MQYLICETENMGQFVIAAKLGNLHWQPTKAQSLAAAKSVAQRARVFQRTMAHVAYVTADSKIVPLAHRSVGGGWFEAAEA